MKILLVETFANCPETINEGKPVAVFVSVVGTTMEMESLAVQSRATLARNASSKQRKGLGETSPVAFVEPVGFSGCLWEKKKEEERR